MPLETTTGLSTSLGTLALARMAVQIAGIGLLVQTKGRDQPLVILFGLVFITRVVIIGMSAPFALALERKTLLGLADGFGQALVNELLIVRLALRLSNASQEG
jgi:hypothetical protein